MGSVFITMSVTIERYFAIVHPLKHFAGKKLLLITPIISSILYNIPKFLEFEWSEVRLIQKYLFIKYTKYNILYFLNSINAEWTGGN